MSLIIHDELLAQFDEQQQLKLKQLIEDIGRHDAQTDEWLFCVGKLLGFLEGSLEEDVIHFLPGFNRA